MKTLLVTLALATSLSTFAQDKIAITEPLIGSASTPGHAMNSFKTMEGCVAFAKKSQEKLSKAGYKIYSNVCEKSVLPGGWGNDVDPSFINNLNFF